MNLSGDLVKEEKKISVKGVVSRKMGYQRNSKKVKQFTMDGRYIATYNSIREAADATGLFFQSISATAWKRQSHTGGYVWQFLSE